MVLTEVVEVMDIVLVAVVLVVAVDAVPVADKVVSVTEMDVVRLMLNVVVVDVTVSVMLSIDGALRLSTIRV